MWPGHESPCTKGLFFLLLRAIEYFHYTFKKWTTKLSLINWQMIFGFPGKDDSPAAKTIAKCNEGQNNQYIWIYNVSPHKAQ